MVRRIRSVVPKFDGAPLLKNGSKNDHARHMSVFFRPWTLDEDHVDEHVPHAINLFSDDVAWQDAWVQWCNGNVLSQQSKHLIINFQAVFCMRQEDDLPTGDKKTDTSIILTVEERKSALRTCMRQSKDGDGKMTNDSSAEASFKLVQQAWGTLTSNTFDRSKHVKSTFKAPRGHAVDVILQAARKSQQNEVIAQEISARAADSEGSVVLAYNSSIVRMVKQWQQKKKAIKTTKTNVEQCRFIDTIAVRMITEANGVRNDTLGASEPLRLLVCGGPGVGKSYVIKALTDLSITLALT